MGRTLKDQMRSDAANVFLNTAGFAENIIHWPLGDHTAAVNVSALVDWNNESRGHGGWTTDTKGRKADRQIVIELSDTLIVTESDKFVVTSGDREYVANAVRLMGRDDAMQTWFCNIPNGFDSRSARVRQ